ncbi:hypothetical protein Tempeh6L_06775 [Lactococcus lactis subsp. lactis]|uniref:hypothetical protein n=1 Tax=Lactococcus lactis TaxID=1358 RepID=UPI0005713195|nr:hypothetical protein [Lactococcus lactis]
MNLDNIYRVRTVYSDFEINLLLENGWLIIATGNDLFTDPKLHAKVAGDIRIMMGSSKEVFENFNLEDYYKTHMHDGRIKPEPETFFGADEVKKIIDDLD